MKPGIQAPITHTRTKMKVYLRKERGEGLLRKEDP
jgi:hypothetical protein